MSAQAGIFYFDGRTVRPDQIAAISTALDAYGPDAGADANPAPGLLMLHRSLHVTPEDRHDRQPVDVVGASLLTWDGRLDNRTDLMMALGVRPTPDVADALVVARAITQWGDEATWTRLVGDWSAALWQPTTRTITLASDYMGIRPLYYVATDTFCAWSTALEGLLALTGRRTEPNDRFFICSVMRSRIPGETPYRDIHLVISGHRVRIDSTGAVDRRQYWHLPDTCLRHRDPRDYQVHVRAVFRQAVARRLRTTHPLWMELSGGWDSSAIVCMAARLGEEGAMATPALATVSHVTPGDPESDETRFIEAVETWTGLPSLHVTLDRTCAPIVPNPVYFRTIAPPRLEQYARMRAAGVRTLLSGRFGDTVFANFPLDLTEAIAALRSRRLLDALRSLRAWSIGTHETAWSLLRNVWADLGSPARAERRDLAEALVAFTQGRTVSSSELSTALCVPAAYVDLFVSTRAVHTRWRLGERREWRSRHFLEGLALYSLNCELSSPPDATGWRQSYPLADRDLVEYVASIPASVLCEPGRPRALMRDALGPMLPDRIRRRFSKGHATPVRARVALQHAPALLAGLDSLQVVERGYVDAQALRGQLEDATAGRPRDVGLLLRVIAIERWLSALMAERMAAAQQSTRKGGGTPWSTSSQRSRSRVRLRPWSSDRRSATAIAPSRRS
jgi:asparagine synthase (glutamine-hydrolysing)